MYSERDAGPSLHSVGVNAIGFFDFPPVPLEKEVNVHRLSGCGIVFVYVTYRFNKVCLTCGKSMLCQHIYIKTNL